MTWVWENQQTLPPPANRKLKALEVEVARIDRHLGRAGHAVDPSGAPAQAGRDYASLITLRNAEAVALGVPLVLPTGTVKVGSNVTIDWLDPNGSIVQPASGVIITATEVIDPGKVQWIDKSAGGDVRFTRGIISRPEWYTSADLSTTDAVEAIQEAYYACRFAFGGTVKLSGEYLLASTAGVQAGDAMIDVSGRGIVIDMREAELVVDDGVDSWDVFRPLPNTSVGVTGVAGASVWEDCDILGGIYDGNGENNLLPPAHGFITQGLFYVEGEGAKRCYIVGVRVRNVAGQRVISMGAAADSIFVQDVNVVLCDFHNIGSGVTGNTNIVDHTTVWIHGLRVNVSGNTFHNDVGIALEATACELHGPSNVFTNNRIWSYGLGMIPSSLFSDHLSCVIGNNSMRNVRTAYRPYTAAGFVMEIDIDGGALSQGDDTLPLIDLDFAAVPIRLCVIRNLTLDHLGGAPSGSDGHGIGLGRADATVIENVTANRLSGNFIRQSTSSAGGWEADQLRLSVRNCRVIDCGRTSAVAADLHRAIHLLSGLSLKSILIDGFEVINTAGSTSPMTHAYVQDCDVTGDITMRRWDVTGPEGRPVFAADDTYSGFVLIDLEGRGAAEGSIRASDASRWLDKTAGTVVTKGGGGNDNTGWA